MNHISLPNVATAPASSTAQLVERYSADSTFFFSSPTRTLLVQEGHEVVSPPCSADRDSSLADHVAALLKSLDSSGHERPMVVGAVPFDNTSPAHLSVAKSVHSAGPLNRAATVVRTPAPVSDASLRMVPGSRDYVRGVEQALVLMRTEPLRKVVLSRMVEATLGKPVDLQQLLLRLTHQNPSGYTFAVNLSAQSADGLASDRSAQTPRQHTLMGASPELLVSRSGLRIVANPLAGSAPRSADPDEDQRRASALLVSEKDRHEHAIVIDAVAAVLRRFCRRLSVPAEPSLVHTQTMWHLSTQLTGELDDPSVTSLQLATALHPTPAVCGDPTDRALAAIKSIEAFDRGFFTGLVGWCDAAGDGEWAVAIRCAEITDRSARLYAGAGIIASSDPERELAETSAKLRTMLNALGLERVSEVV